MYWFGRPGGYQTYWLSYNLSGAGDMAFHYPAQGYRRGAYRDSKETQSTDEDTEPPDSSRITANTLTILGPHGDHRAMMTRYVLGADEGITRLARE